jgi:hypothetical protein
VVASYLFFGERVFFASLGARINHDGAAVGGEKQVHGVQTWLRFLRSGST